MTNIEAVRMLTGDAKISDEFISFYLDSTEKFILGYCNLTAVPETLMPTMLEITSLRVKANSKDGAPAIGQGLTVVAGVSDGNQSVSYQAGASGTKVFISEEDIVATYGHMLDRYRKMVVDRPYHPEVCDTNKYTDKLPHLHRSRYRYNSNRYYRSR